MVDLKLIGGSGVPLCRWCHAEVQSHHEEFCSETCQHAHQVATPAQRLRQHVFLRDRGVCHKCGMDCEELKQTILNIVSLYGSQYARSVLMTTGFKKLEATTLAQDPAQDFWIVEEREGDADLSETTCRACMARRRKRKTSSSGEEDSDLFDEVGL